MEEAAGLLGVATDAPPESLQAAYRRLALRWQQAQQAQQQEQQKQQSSQQQPPKKVGGFDVLDVWELGLSGLCV